jgi:predicted RNase H-like nuclease (RuvC/YqgF family)
LTQTKQQEELEAVNKQLAERDAKLATMTADRDELLSKLAEREQNPQPQPQHQLYAQIEELKERNRQLCIKSREERQKLEEKIAALEYRDESQSRRLEEKQNRLDELEAAAELHRGGSSIDLPEQVGEIVNFLKELLPPDTKWPKRVIPSLRKFLETKENDEQAT